MQKYTIKKGTTSKILQIDIYDSSSTVGARLAGLVYNTASLSAYYNREGAAGAATAITLATATKGTWATGGFIAIDATNMPGHYELHIPDAALATGANSVLVELKGAANMVPKTILIELVDNVEADTYTIVNNGTYGNSALNTDLDTLLTRIVGTLLTGSHNPQGGDAFARLGAPAAASIAADLLVIDNFVDDLETRLTAVRAGYLDNLSVGAVAQASVCTETRLAELDAANLPTDIAGVQADTDNIQTRIPAALVGGRMDSSVGSNLDKTGYGLSATAIQAIWDALTSALTTVGSIGKLLVDNINATISSRSSHAAADVWSVATRTLTSFGTLVSDIWANATRTLTSVGGIKKNTAFNSFDFLMVDSTDHVTGETGLTVTAQRSINGGAFAACANAVSELANGKYLINLAAADLNGDIVALRFTATGADTRNITIITTP